MSDLKDSLTALQNRAATLINARDYLSDVDIVTEVKGDLGNRLDQSLAKLGLAICVLTPALTIHRREPATGRLILKVKLVVDISENALLNADAEGNRRPALDAALEVMKALDYKTTGLGKSSAYTEFDRYELDPNTALQLIPDKTLICYHVTATTLISFNP